MLDTGRGNAVLDRHVARMAARVSARAMWSGETLPTLFLSHGKSSLPLTVTFTGGTASSHSSPGC
jgi:hypothetical protein